MSGDAFNPRGPRRQSTRRGGREDTSDRRQGADVVDPSGAVTGFVMVPHQELRRLREAIEDIQERLAELRAGEDWVGPDIVAKMTGYKPNYVAELVRRRGLPAHRVGRKFRFRRSEVNEWIENGGKR